MNMQKSEGRRFSRGHRPWRSSGSDASADFIPAMTSLTTPRVVHPPPMAHGCLNSHKPERRRERGLRRIWSAVRSASGGGSTTPGTDLADFDVEGSDTPACSLPLLQVWPTQDSPRGEADGQSFTFPVGSPRSPQSPADNSFPHDSGIESVQASPSPQPCSSSSEKGGATSPGCKWKGGLLHPDHARLLRQPGVDEDAPPVATSTGGGRLSNSSSTTSSMNSVNYCSQSSQRTSDPWLRDERRRSSIMTTRYSLFDALDLEYALLRAAARGSVGPYSLSESLHKLTFTQSLAFPALARGLAGKKSRTPQSQTTPATRSGSSLNSFAKVLTTLILVLLSVLVFCVVYKFVQT